ncbi:MAG: IclR family transcriptional regulator domain-containing protein, partial [Gammaproteobacteria bacterium]
LPAFAASMGRVILTALPEPELADWLRAQKFRAMTPHTIHTAKALKAELRRVREQGYAVVVRELELGLCSIAVPLHDSGGRVVAGLNVGMPYSEDAPRRAISQILPALQEAQHEIEQAIRRVGWLPHMVVGTSYAR